MNAKAGKPVISSSFVASCTVSSESLKTQKADSGSMSGSRSR